MIEEMLEYQKEIEKILDRDNKKTRWSVEAEIFKTRFSNLQTERLIHLLVMLTVGIGTIISFYETLNYPSVALYLMDLMLAFLFLAYVLYYWKT